MNSISRILRSHGFLSRSFLSFYSSSSSSSISMLNKSLTNQSQQALIPIHDSSESLHDGSRIFSTAWRFVRPIFFHSGTSNIFKFDSNLSMNGRGTNVQLILPYLTTFRSLIHSETPNEPSMDTKIPKPDELYQPKEVARPMDFVRGIVETPQFNKLYVGSHPHVVLIDIKRNNSFVTVFDYKGYTKVKGTNGMLKIGEKGKLPRYNADAICEMVGKNCRNIGITAVVMKVKGFIHFKRKKQAILAWKAGFTGSKGEMNPIVGIEDITRKQHNGCRKRKRRRVK